MSERSLDDANISALENAGEIGKFLVPIYVTALSVEPNLENVIVYPHITRGKHKNLLLTSGWAIPARYTNSGKPGVHIRTDSWTNYSRRMKARTAHTEIINQMLNLENQEFSPQIFAAFVFAHELGHAKHWKIYDESPGRRAELSTLPVPGQTPPVIISDFKMHPIRRWLYMREHRERLAVRGIHTPAQLIVAQEVDYRALPSESAADGFAVEVVTASGIIEATSEI